MLTLQSHVFLDPFQINLSKDDFCQFLLVPENVLKMFQRHLWIFNHNYSSIKNLKYTVSIVNRGFYMNSLFIQKQPMEVVHKKAVFKYFAIFTVKQLRCSLFLNKVAGLQACNFIQKRLQHKCFPVNITNFLEHPFWKTSANNCFCFLHIGTINGFC